MGLFNPLKAIGDVVDAGAHVLSDAGKDAGKAFEGAVQAAKHLSPSDIGHAVLDGVGMIPVVGAAADLANAGWYAADGDWGDAALSAASAVPLVGDAALAAKWGKRAVEVTEAGVDIAKTMHRADEVADAAKIVGGGEKAADAAKDATDVEKVAKGGDEAAGGAKKAEVDKTDRVAGSGKPTAAREPTDADLAGVRARHGGVQDDTAAVGFTNVPGLEGETFEGLSAVPRRNAGLSETHLDDTYGPGRIKAPVDDTPKTARFRGHAEEHLANDFDAKVQARGLKPEDLNGKTLNIRISKESGVCNNCFQGLTTGSDAGVIKQLSEKYPGLTIRISVKGGADARPGMQVLTVRNGQIINHP